MTARSALVDGLFRESRAPAVLIGVWLLTIAMSLPLALGVRSRIQDHLGNSLAAETAASGVNYEWWQEFSEQASGVAVTFRPTIIGFGAVLDNLSGFIDDDLRPIVIIVSGLIYAGLWIFLAGGIIDRYARQRPTRAPAFFSACGTFFFRFLRLTIVMAIVYGFLFGWVHPWLFRTTYGRMIHDVTVERTAFEIRLVLYLVFGILLAACNLIFDYAKVRAVVEDRRSMLGAIRAAAVFVQRNYAGAVALYLADMLIFALVLVLYALVAPATAPAGWRSWLAFGIGELYIMARLWVKLVFWATETALFQGRLAHAGYVATPVPVWPESPAAEAIQRG